MMQWGKKQSSCEHGRCKVGVTGYCRQLLDAGSTRGTVGVKLASVRQLYEVLVWSRLREDSPAASLTARRKRTSRDERGNFPLLSGLKRLLSTPEGDSAREEADRAILVLMGTHGPVGAAADVPEVTEVDLSIGWKSSASHHRWCASPAAAWR